MAGATPRRSATARTLTGPAKPSSSIPFAAVARLRSGRTPAPALAGASAKTQATAPASRSRRSSATAAEAAATSEPTGRAVSSSRLETSGVPVESQTPRTTSSGTDTVA